MQLSEKAADWLQTLDFGYVLPLMARLPLPVGQALSTARGLLNAATDYEWRSLAIHCNYIRERTYQAMKMMRPDAGENYWKQAAIRRFIHNSRDEWQACLYDLPVMEKICRQSSVEGIDALLEQQAKGRGIAMVSCHFDGFMGMALLGMKGLCVNALTTAAGNEDPRIHPAVRRYLNKKYRRLESRMNGQIVYKEDNMPFFQKALARGETVVLFGDVPGSKSSVFIPFLNARFKAPLGAWHLAAKTHSLISATVCIHEGVGRYRVICLPPAEIDPNSPLHTLRPIYAFLEKHIRRLPERWVAADLLPTYSGMQ
jgi:lauroyl/myristoyl acyltransferase